MKLLLYCNKALPWLEFSPLNMFPDCYGAFDEEQEFEQLNGLIVAECDYEVEPVDLDSDNFDWLLEGTDKTMKEIQKYVGNSKTLYAIHIKNLHIFDEPREPKDYLTWDWVEYPTGLVYAVPERPVKKINQMLKVMSSKYNDEAMVVPFGAEELAKILNGWQKTFLKKRILKEMKQ